MTLEKGVPEIVPRKDKKRGKFEDLARISVSSW